MLYEVLSFTLRHLSVTRKKREEKSVIACIDRKPFLKHLWVEREKEGKRKEKCIIASCIFSDFSLETCFFSLSKKFTVEIIFVSNVAITPFFWVQLRPLTQDFLGAKASLVLCRHHKCFSLVTFQSFLPTVLSF